MIKGYEMQIDLILKNSNEVFNKLKKKYNILPFEESVMYTHIIGLYVLKCKDSNPKGEQDFKDVGKQVFKFEQKLMQKCMDDTFDKMSPEEQKSFYEELTIELRSILREFREVVSYLKEKSSLLDKGFATGLKQTSKRLKKTRSITEDCIYAILNK